MPEIVLRVIGDDATGANALIAGEIDYMQYLPFDLLPLLGRAKDVKLMSLTGLDMFQGNFRVNAASGPFSDPAVRAVLWKLVDQKEMLEAAGIGPAMRLDRCPDFFMCGAPLATEAGSDIARFDPAAAKTALARTGYKGEPVIMLQVAGSISQAAGSLLSQHMRQAGFTVDEQVMDWGTVLQRRGRKEGWSVFPVYSNGVEMASPLTHFYISNNCGDYPGWSCSAATTELLAQFAAATDDAARKRIAVAIQEDAYRTTPSVMWGQFSRPAGLSQPAAEPDPVLVPDLLGRPAGERLMPDAAPLAATPVAALAATLPGLDAAITVIRDEWGIPHIRAGSAADAHFALGFVHAQDRLFQMELTRRRALGRAAAWLGADAAASDALCRRLGMEAACRRDYAALGAEARSMLERYAAGVNAFLGTGAPLPVEYGLLGAEPEPWAPWHCIAVMRRLGLLMGSVWFKLARILALPVVGAENAAKLRYDGGEAELLTIPTGATATRLSADLAALRPAIKALLAAMGPDETGGGSNNWAVGPGRSATGRPILAGDPHRVFEVPGMYAQHHLACDEWDAIGLTVPGVPGFPHYMHNGRVACCVTHAFVDIHDLFLDRFDEAGEAALFQDAWEPVRRRTETIEVRGEPDRSVTITETRHGPVIAGDPGSGAALVLRSVQFADTDLSFDCLPRMLRAASVPALFEATRGWGLIDHNLVAADTEGRIGHRVRALVPRRPRENGWFAVPGWTGEGEWDGYIPHEAMPEVIDGPGTPTGAIPTGMIVTANNRVLADGEPYLCTDCHPPYRAARIAALLDALPHFAVADAAAIHADVLSPNAPLFQARLRALPPLSEAPAAALRDELLGWDGRMDAASVAAGRYIALRRAMTALLARRSGLDGMTAHPWSAVPPGISPVGNLWWALPTLLRQDDTAMLDGWSWDDVLRAALALAAEQPRLPWGELHRAVFQHPLSAQFPAEAAALNPPSLPLGGDGDTVMAIGMVPAAGTAGTYGALCRYVIDVGGWDNSRWAVFHGASGQPGSPHYTDQAADWAGCRMVPMRYAWPGIEAAAATTQVLSPAASIQ